MSFTNLPRGQYKLSLSPVAVSTPTPVALSRAQESTLRVITYQDVALVLGILFVIGFLMVGRWYILSRRIKRRQRQTVSSVPSA